MVVGRKSLNLLLASTHQPTLNFLSAAERLVHAFSSRLHTEQKKLTRENICRRVVVAGLKKRIDRVIILSKKSRGGFGGGK